MAAPLPKTTTALELWEGGDVRSKNIGPSKGEHLLGRIEGPGLYLFVARNAGGKSQHLSLIARLQDERLMRSDAPITDGELSAYFQIAEGRVTFRRTAAGDVREPKREGLETLPEIELLPAPIDELITGAHLQGDDPRARRRLKALLSYAPIESTPEIVEQLCECLQARVFGGAVGLERVKAWGGLLTEVRGHQKRLPSLSPENATEIQDWLIERPREGILDDHGLLVDRLNQLGNVAEKLALRQAEHVAAADGRLQEVVEATSRAVGEEPSEDLVDRLLEAPTQTAAAAAMQSARDRAAELRVARRKMLEEEERREGLRASHGARPDRTAEAAELAAAKTRLADAVVAVKAHAGEIETARARLESRSPVAAREMQVLRRFFADLHAAVASLDSMCPDSSDQAFSMDLQADPAEVLKRITATADEFGRQWLVARQSMLDHQKDTELVDAAGAKHRDALAERSAAAALVADREAAVQRLDERIAAWESTAALLDADLAGPTADELAAAESEANAAAVAVRLSESAKAYQDALAAHERELALLEWLEAMATDYRAAKDDSWNALGRVVTAELALPWLSVDGLRIKLHYDRTTGALRTDPEAEADERDLDDEDRISAGELHEAMLRLMLTRRERLGGILILPWQVVAALDEQRLARLAGEAETARLVVLSERPRRKGDPDDLRLERVATGEAVPS